LLPAGPHQVATIPLFLDEGLMTGRSIVLRTIRIRIEHPAAGNAAWTGSPIQLATMNHLRVFRIVATAESTLSRVAHSFFPPKEPVKERKPKQ
jgi:hypothetical protein